MNADDLEIRRTCLDELATATRHTPLEGAIAIYLRSLEGINTSTLAEACSRLMQTAKFFPSVAEIREQARLIHAEEERQDASQLYSRKEWLPPARAKLWMDHLRETIEALKHGRPRPAPPEPLDTAGPTFKCRQCQDLGFVRVCNCGQRACRMCRYEYFRDCSCKPPRPEPTHARATA